MQPQAACICRTPGYCPRYRTEIHGRFHDICQAKPGIPAATRAYQIAQWEKRRDSQVRRPERHETRCMYLGDGLTDANGKLIQEECGPCGDGRLTQIYQCHHIGHAASPRTTEKACKVCPDYNPPPEDAVDGIDLADLGMATSIPRRPVLCRSDGASVEMKDHFRGRTAFFLGGGPSLGSLPLHEFQKRHIITLAVNNVSEVFQPMLWMCVDAPDKFPQRIFDDPYTWKLLPRGLARYQCANGREVQSHPSVLYFRRNARFRPETFLTEPTFNWGCQTGVSDGLGCKGGRSVMLAAIKMLWYLGCARVVLLGCDFHMDAERPYAHSENKDDRATISNNLKYKCLDTRFRVLRPVFDEAGFTVLNGTEGSRLTAFDPVDPMAILEEADAEV